MLVVTLKTWIDLLLSVASKATLSNMPERECEEADAKRVNEVMALIEQNNCAGAIQILLPIVKDAPGRLLPANLSHSL